MATLSYNTECYIRRLMSNFSYREDNMKYLENASSPSIANYNIFNKFFVFDCRGEDKFQVPTVFGDNIARWYSNFNIKRFIKPLYKGTDYYKEHRGMTSILKYMYGYRGIGDGCTKHKTSKNEIYHTYGNIILDEYFNILLLPCFDITKVNGELYIDSITYKVSNLLYSPEMQDSIVSKFIIKKMIPYLLENGSFSNYNLNSLHINNPIKMRVEIGDLSEYVCTPNSPNSSTQEELNYVLRTMMPDMLECN